MIYTAKHFMEISGEKYIPGDLIEKEIPAEKLERFLRIGAVAPLDLPEGIVMAGTINGLDGSDADSPDADVSDAESHQESTSEINDEEYAEAEEAEAPVIDVTDGIVSEQPKATKGRKNA